MNILDFFSNLDFLVLRSPFPNQYKDLFSVPDDIPYSELEEIEIATVSKLPLDIQLLVGKQVSETPKFIGEFEQLINYRIELTSERSYLITRYTNYQ